MSLEGEKMPVEIEKIANFVRDNIVDSNNSGLECSDGRYMPEQSEGRIRIFGGDFGAVAAIIGALEKKGFKYSLENIFGRYKDAVVQNLLPHDGFMHIHAHCGHIKTMSDKFSWGGELYGLFLEELEKKGKKETELKGEHEEEDVLFISGVEKSINSKDAETGESHFIVDIDRISNYFNILPGKLTLLQLTGQDVWEAYAEQMGQTKQAIGAGDKKIYTVNLRGEPVISRLA